MITRASVTDAIRNFSDYLNRVAYRGERFLLIRGGKAVAELAPVSTGARVKDLSALLSSLPHLDEEEASALQRDIDEARRSAGAIEERDPWAS